MYQVAEYLTHGRKTWFRIPVGWTEKQHLQNSILNRDFSLLWVFTYQVAEYLTRDHKTWFRIPVGWTDESYISW